MWYHYTDEICEEVISFEKEECKIINLKLIRENGDVKFKAYGEEIDEHFHGEYEEGDRY